MKPVELKPYGKNSTHLAGKANGITARDGYSLRVAQWAPHEEAEVRGTVFFSNGYIEFIEKYAGVYEALRTRGYHVVTHDWRGQGQNARLLSDPGMGYIDTYDTFVDDALLIYETVVKNMPGPHVLMGHSMGGNVALRLLQANPELFAKAVLISPFLGVKAHRLRFVRTLSALALLAGLGKRYALDQKPADIETVQQHTTDASRFDELKAFYRENPEYLINGASWRWLHEAARSAQRIMAPEAAAGISVPTLLVTAMADDLVDLKAHAKLAALCPRISRLCIPDEKHEVLIEKPQVLAQFWEAFDGFTGACAPKADGGKQ